MFSIHKECNYHNKEALNKRKEYWKFLHVIELQICLGNITLKKANFTKK